MYFGSPEEQIDFAFRMIDLKRKKESWKFNVAPVSSKKNRERYVIVTV